MNFNKMFIVVAVTALIMTNQLLVAKIIVNQKVEELDTTFYDLTNSLPPGHAKDGSVDYSEILREAISQHPKVMFPNFPVLVNHRGISIGSHKTLLFQEKSELILAPNDQPAYNILQLRRVENVTIINPKITGDKDKHLGKDGQWGFGIGIFSAENINIINPVINSCWGDGIYIGKSSDVLTPSRNISIVNATLVNNRRNGISVISVDGLTINKAYIAFTEGHNPMNGIDIEPNGYQDEIRNVKLNNVTTESNKGGGILVYLCSMYGGGEKVIDIEVNDHIDINSKHGLRIMSYKLKPELSGIVKGNIKVNNALWKRNSGDPVNLSHLRDKSVKVQFNSPRIQTSTGRILSKRKSGDLIKSANTSQSTIVLK